MCRARHLRVTHRRDLCSRRGSQDNAHWNACQHEVLPQKWRDALPSSRVLSFSHTNTTTNDLQRSGKCPEQTRCTFGSSKSQHPQPCAQCAAVVGICGLVPSSASLYRRLTSANCQRKRIWTCRLRFAVTVATPRHSEPILRDFQTSNPVLADCAASDPVGLWLLDFRLLNGMLGYSQGWPKTHVCCQDVLSCDWKQTRRLLRNEK